jgi:hypothetical protein
MSVSKGEVSPGGVSMRFRAALLALPAGAASAQDYAAGWASTSLKRIGHCEVSPALRGKVLAGGELKMFESFSGRPLSTG